MMEEQGEYPQLLFMRAEDHRTSTIPKRDNYTLRVNSHKCGIPYHEKYAPGLQRLGLYQISQLDDCQIDRSLVSALVEWWRPETNTFHFPVGEMTVTLEDVAILWGLSLRGEAISGKSDDEWSQLIHDCLGIDPAYPDEDPTTGPWKYKVKKRGQEEDVIYSGYHLRLAWLHSKFKRLPDNADDETIDLYTRAYCLDLLGSVMFPDSSADGVPAMFLQFLENLHDPPEYNWGCAVLAYLYRELSRSCTAGTETLSGPMLLLQMWSWTRLNIGRPEPLFEPLPFGGEDEDARNAFGVKWTTRHCYPANPHHGGPSHYRDEIEKIPDAAIDWRPYGMFYSMLPTRTSRDCGLWLARMPMVFFWIVEFHYPDRVMRQFNLYQSVPPPAPDPWFILQRLRSQKHVSGRGKCKEVDWSLVHKAYIDVEPNIITEMRPWNSNVMREYMHWFHTRCMGTAWPSFGDPTVFSRPLPPIEGNVSELAYEGHGHKYRRVLMRTMHHTANGIQWLLTRGKKAVGKLTLQMCRGTMEDLEARHLYEGMLTRAGLPADISAVPVDDDVPTSPPSMPPPPEFRSGFAHFSHNRTGFNQGHHPSMPPPPDSYAGYMNLLMGNTGFDQGGSSSSAPPFIPTPGMYGAPGYVVQGGYEAQSGYVVQGGYEAQGDYEVHSTPLNDRLRDRPRDAPKRYTPSDYPPGRQQRARE